MLFSEQKIVLFGEKKLLFGERKIVLLGEKKLFGEQKIVLLGEKKVLFGEVSQRRIQNLTNISDRELRNNS